jgi:hypothetical protein
MFAVIIQISWTSALRIHFPSEPDNLRTAAPVQEARLVEHHRIPERGIAKTSDAWPKPASISHAAQQTPTACYEEGSASRSKADLHTSAARRCDPLIVRRATDFAESSEDPHRANALRVRLLS